MKLLICTIGFTEDKQWIIFKKEVEKILGKNNYKGKYSYVFETLSVTYVEGGTHVICVEDEEISAQMKEDFQNLVANEMWADYQLKIIT